MIFQELDKSAQDIFSLAHDMAVQMTLGHTDDCDCELCDAKRKLA